jgi:peptide-methionine (S)-S-oxide reductase
MNGVSRTLTRNVRFLGTSMCALFLVSQSYGVLGQDQVTTSTKNPRVVSRKSAATKTKPRRLPAGPNQELGSLKTGPATAVSNDADVASATAGAPSTSDSKSGAGTSEAYQSPSEPAKPKTEVATFGAGCFWHVEAEFEWLPGVKSAISGYSGGASVNPSYDDVHEGWTGHAEVVQVEYDPSVISYEKLLRVFWSGHDPTQLNRQGPDYGTQYRSVIFYHSPEQKQAALKSYQELTRARVFRAPIVTQLAPMEAFYPAEEYHQNYYGGRDGRKQPSRRTKRAKKPAVAPPATKQKIAAKDLANVFDGKPAEPSPNAKSGNE